MSVYKSLLKVFLQGQNLDAKIKSDMVNFVGGCVSSMAANYFMGGQQSKTAGQQGDSSCWDSNQWDTKWSTGNSEGNLLGLGLG